MKIFHPASLTFILAKSNADAKPTMRDLHRGGGFGMHGGGGGGRRGDLASKLNSLSEQCEVFDCNPVDTDAIDCNLTKPERPDNIMDMSEEEREVAWSDMKAKREEFRQEMLSCGCCTEATFEELLRGIASDLAEGEGPGGHGHHWGEGFDKNDGHPGPHGGWAARMEWLEDACELYDCDLLDTESINCNMMKPERPNMMSMSEEERENARLEMRASRKEYRQEVLKCGCCTDATFDTLLARDIEDTTTSVDGLEEDTTSEDGLEEDTSSEDANGGDGNVISGGEEDEGFEGTEVSVVKASLLAEKNSITAEESYLKNSVGNNAVSFALACASVGVVFLVV